MSMGKGRENERARGARHAEDVNGEDDQGNHGVPDGEWATIGLLGDGWVGWIAA